MPWVRVDDHFPDHHKLAELGDLAPLGGWLALCGLAWCNRQLTDGRIPKAQVHRLASFRHVAVAGASVDVEHVAEALVRVGLWDVTADGRAYQIHDYHHYQPSKAEVLAERARNTARKRRDGPTGRYTGGTGGRTGGTPAGTWTRPVPDPDPKYPVPKTPDTQAAAGAAGPRVVTAPLGARREHLNHACCGRVCLPAVLFTEFVRLHGGDEQQARAYVSAFFKAHDPPPDAGPIGDDAFTYWRRVWAAHHPSAAPDARTIKAAQRHHAGAAAEAAFLAAKDAT